MLAGKRTLPSAESMAAAIRADAAADLEQFPRDAARIGALTDYMRYMTSLAQLIGCQPRWTHLLTHRPDVWLRTLVGPIIPAQYRLYGPGCDQARAARAILCTPRMPLAIVLYELLLLLGCKLLACLGAKAFAPIGF